MNQIWFAVYGLLILARKYCFWYIGLALWLDFVLEAIVPYFPPPPPCHLHSIVLCCIPWNKNSQSWGALYMLCCSQATEGPRDRASLSTPGSCTARDGHQRTSERPSGPATLISIYASHHYHHALYLAIEFEISHSPWDTLWDTKE